MALQVFQIPALSDNYIHVVRNASGQTAVVDPSLAKPVHQFLKERGWSLDYILNTHHHYDHTDGNGELKKVWDAQVIGFSQDAHRIPYIDQKMEEDEIWHFGHHPCHILFIPGHTLGHIAFWFPKDDVLFCGDTLFAMGCGRLFEGTKKQMLSSLNKLSKLPEKTTIYCGHEYSENNGQFALQIEGGNSILKKRMKQIIEKRKHQLSTVPFTLLEELQTNPFLRCDEFSKNSQRVTHSALRKWIQNKKDISELEWFTKIRELKDHF